MYESHFGMKQRPFRSIPDSDCYYPATTTEQALARLIQAMSDDEGFALITGEPGTGKTLFCQCLIDRLGETTQSTLLTNTHVPDRAGLLQAILYDLGLPYTGRCEQEMRLALTEHLLNTFRNGRPVLLVIDEAQNLTEDAHEELRLLSNLEGRQGRAVRIVLAGQPRLVQTLQQPELASLWQRIAVRVTLQPLGREEAADYLVWHLRNSGVRPEAVINDEALEILSQGTLGVPRLLNRAAHQALLLAWAANARPADAEAALEALSALGLQREEENAASAEEPEEEPTRAVTVHEPEREIRKIHRLFAPPPRTRA